MAATLDRVRSLFVPGGQVRCVENTYHDTYIGRVWDVATVGKTVWTPVEGDNFRGTLPTRAGDVLYVDENRATWKIKRGEHTVTYERIAVQA